MWGKNNQPSITDLLMAMLGSARNTRIYKRILYERQFKQYEKESVSMALYRLKSRGYIESGQNGWSATEKGRDYFRAKSLLNHIPSSFKGDSPANTLLAFDIPEPDRKIRTWLRNQIKIFGYKMLQKSLWIGPGPLPAVFFKRLEDLGIRKNVKTFRIVKQN